MGYEVLISPLAKRQLKKLKGSMEFRDIASAIDSLAETPKPASSRNLSGHPFRRIRVGSFRIVYSIEEERILILILKVGQRRDIYKGLEELRRIYRKMKT